MTGVPEFSGPSGELIGAVFLDERMIYEFSLSLVEETISVIDMKLDTPATTALERVILKEVRNTCEARLNLESR